MDLNEKSAENVSYMLDQMAKKLEVANQIVFDPKGYDLSKYDEIKFMYDFIMKQNTLSAAETTAFIDELRSVRVDS
ncbi:MAG TPA: DUF1128 domain-containing protein [Bacillota bacterium]|nr:DUF1128 domain-containing protein [Bacillota bacterium]